jgi:hypothetical protein
MHHAVNVVARKPFIVDESGPVELPDVSARSIHRVPADMFQNVTLIVWKPKSTV